MMVTGKILKLIETKKIWFLPYPSVIQEVPPNWVPANRLEVVDGVVMPDKLGHTPGSQK